IKGHRIGEIRDLTKSFKSMMSIHEEGLESESQTGEAENSEAAELKLGDLEALRGVVKFPVRIKCATLGWNTLQQGLDEALSSDS
ncbi:MAG: SUF system NifU family Fe-S cluster assembly protein, partial [Microthrixaceae bacterium]